MLNNLALAASIICALSAVSTSLRALGVSRDHARYDLDAKIKTGCRISEYKSAPLAPKRGSLRLHLFVTIVWYALSVIFALPLLIQGPSGRGDNGLLLWLLPFILLAAVLWFIWRAIKKSRHESLPK